MGLKYEPALEPLHIHVKYLFLKCRVRWLAGATIWRDAKRMLFLARRSALPSTLLFFFSITVKPRLE